MEMPYNHTMGVAPSLRYLKTGFGDVEDKGSTRPDEVGQL
jgi:hypothetical protein